MGNVKRVANGILFSICLMLVISGSWVVLALVAHSNLDDPLCGRACYDIGVVPPDDSIQMNGGE